MRDLVKLPEANIREGAIRAFSILQQQELHGRPSAMSLATSEKQVGHLGDCFEFVARGEDDKERIGPIPDSTARLILALAAMHAAWGVRRPTEQRGQWSKPEYLTTLGEFKLEEIGRALTDILRVRTLRERNFPLTKHYKRIAEHIGHRATGRAGEDFLRLVFTLSLNREGDGAVFDSVKTVKADAARRLFALSNGKITWAVIDSGIDASHCAFRDYNVPLGDNRDESAPRLNANESRVDRRYNMALISHLRNRDTMRNEKRRKALARVIANTIDLPGKADPENALNEVEKMLREVADNLGSARQIDWDLAERIMRVRHDEIPKSHHGTHVAGTLGGCWEGYHDDNKVRIEGMCPDIRLFDFNILGGSTKATEFAVVAALRLIRHLNERNDYMVIHGANLSLAIPHDVTNYACGRTPVCVESESLVANGVVVVAAAGNVGYNLFKTKVGEVPLHTEASITDPGNAEGVITVGSTHRLEPHTYGVSYFSSRGPTGDGRMKPDLVAPGEKIDGPICNNEFARLEGTSMAAPHVSGAASGAVSRPVCPVAATVTVMMACAAWDQTV
ncbi:MAG: hypothetical protein EP339_00595, partial [Gammaproteobacteria bacterium]